MRRIETCDNRAAGGDGSRRRRHGSGRRADWYAHYRAARFARRFGAYVDAQFASILRTGEAAVGFSLLLAPIGLQQPIREIDRTTPFG